MSLVRKSPDISTNAPSYKIFADLLTPYAFSHLKGGIKKIERVKVYEQIDLGKYHLKDKGKSLVAIKKKC